MKAVSQLMSVILVLSIAIAMVALLWLFISGTYTFLTQTGESTVSESLVTISSCMKIESVSGNQIYLRNCGKGIITQDTLKVYLDDIPLNITSLTSPTSTFGKTDVGNSYYTGSYDRPYATKVTLNEDGDVTEISLYGRLPSSGSVHMMCAIYSDDNNDPDVLLGVSNEITVTTTLQWWDFTFDPVVSLTAGDYWLAFNQQTNPSFEYYFDTVSDASRYESGLDYDDGFPSPAPSMTHLDKQISIYATYTPLVIINKDEVGVVSLSGLWNFNLGGHLLKVTNPKVITERAVEAVLPDSCVLSLDFDEGSGIVAYDKSGYRNDGTIYGAQWVSGRYGNALEFDGINDYISISDSDSLDLTENFTIGVVLNIKSISPMGSKRYILSKIGNYELYIGGSGEMGPYIGGSVGLNSGTSDGLQILGGLMNKRYIVFKHNFLQTGTDVSISSDFNTDVVIFEIDTAHSSANNNPLLIGYDGTSNWLNATIDSVRIYNKALTPDEAIILKPVSYD